MNRRMMICFTAVCLGALLTRAPAGAGDRSGATKGRPVPVPTWTELDRRAWGDLVLGETTRAEFEANYASSPTERGAVLQATTPELARTQMFLIFDGADREARLTWVVCFHENPLRAPQPAELLGRADWQELEGYPLTRRAGWRIFAAPEQGFAAVVELRKTSYLVVALIMGRPERVSEVAGRLEPAPSLGSPRAPDKAGAPFRAPVGEPEVDVRMAPTLQGAGERLEREVVQAADTRMRNWPVLQVTEGGQGRLAVMLEVEPRIPGDDSRITLTARVSLDTESEGLAIHTRSDVLRRTLDAASSDLRIQEEARRLVERGIDTVAVDAQEQLQIHKTKLTITAQREVSPALLDFLVGASR